jgi:hypothetical protein
MYISESTANLKKLQHGISERISLHWENEETAIQQVLQAAQIQKPYMIEVLWDNSGAGYPLLSYVVLKLIG